jgi:hypothetical protein
MLIHFWVFHPQNFGPRQEALQELLDRYPMDAQMIYISMPGVFETPGEDAEYRWFHFDDPYRDTDVALDQRIALTDWDRFDSIVEHFPDPYYEGMFRHDVPPDGRYRLGYWWFWLFERHWSWRGMANALMDYYDHPEQVHRLFRVLTDFYLVALERAVVELGVDGIMISDDLGHQTGTFFSMGIFERFFRPYYQQIIDKAHSLSIHIWLHACGCIEALLPILVDMGLDVVHPIQKHTTMDYEGIAHRFGSQISIWAGLDVQQVIPWGTPQEVRREVRYLIDTFNRPEGRLLLAAGNAIHEDCPLPSLEAFLDEAYTYGTAAINVCG